MRAAGVDQLVDLQGEGGVIAVGRGHTDVLSVHLHFDIGIAVELQGDILAGSRLQGDVELLAEVQGISQDLAGIHVGGADALELIGDLRDILLDDFGINVAPAVIDFHQAVLILFLGFVGSGGFFSGCIIGRLFRRRFGGGSFFLLFLDRLFSSRSRLSRRDFFRSGRGLGCRRDNRSLLHYGSGLSRRRGSSRRFLLYGSRRRSSFHNGSSLHHGCRFCRRSSRRRWRFNHLYCFFCHRRFHCFLGERSRQNGEQHRGSAQDGEYLPELFLHDPYPSPYRPWSVVFGIRWPVRYI